MYTKSYAGTIHGAASLYSLFRQHGLLCVGSSLTDSHCVRQFAQKSILDVFYRLQLSFFRWPAAALILGFYHVHSAEKQDKPSFSTENE